MNIYIIEGIDGSGKSTVSKFIKGMFPDKEIMDFREPDGLYRSFLSRAGRNEIKINHMDEWICFWMNRFDLWVNVILPRVNDDVIVIIDRSFVSTYAYQISGRMLNNDYVTSFFFWRERLLELFADKDATICHIYMRASVKVAQARISSRKVNAADLIQFEEERMQQRVKSGFDIYYNDKLNLKSFEKVVIINADNTLDEVNLELQQKLLA